MMCMDPAGSGVVQVERQAPWPADRPKVTTWTTTISTLTSRLAALEARAPGSALPPALPRRRRRGRFALPMAMAPVLVLALVATAAAGAVVISRMAEGYPGIENPGQPLAGASMECMTPPDAAAFLAAHGYTQVDWQVETGTATSAGRRQGDELDRPRLDAAGHGYVIPGSLLPDGR